MNMIGQIIFYDVKMEQFCSKWIKKYVHTFNTISRSRFICSEAVSPERADFVSQLGAAFHNIGFVGVINHGIPQDLVTEFYNLSKDFFSAQRNQA